MDPLSVTSGIVGILAASGQLITTLWKLGNDPEDAASDAAAVAEELEHITVIVQGLQKYIQGQAYVLPQRSHLITLEKITVTVTRCVLTLSELNEMIESLSGQDARKAFRWLLRKGKITSLLARLRSYKTTFVIMLNILQSENLDTAEQHMARLHDIVDEVLTTNRELALRMDDWKIMNSPSAATSIAPASVFTRNRRHARRAANDSRVNFLGSLNASTTTINSNTPTRPFEEMLHRTRVYQRAIDNQSLFSHDAQSTIARSLSSSVTLGEISNMSVYALPVNAHELSNTSCYITPDRTTAHPRLIDTARYIDITQRQTSIVRDLGDCVFDHGSFRWHVFVSTTVIECVRSLKSTRGTEVNELFDQRIDWQKHERLQFVLSHLIRPDEMDWTDYNACDAAAVLLRYLSTLWESLIPPGYYKAFHYPFRLFKIGHSDLESTVSRYRKLFVGLSFGQGCLFLYMLDFLAVLASKSEINGMAASDLSEIFQAALLDHPYYQWRKHDYVSAVDMLTFLIHNQAYFLMHMLLAEDLSDAHPIPNKITYSSLIRAPSPYPR